MNKNTTFCKLYFAKITFLTFFLMKIILFQKNVLSLHRISKRLSTNVQQKK